MSANLPVPGSKTMKVHPARASVERTAHFATLTMAAVGAVGGLGALTCVFDELDVPGVLFELLCYAAWIAAAVLFCMWLHRAYRDAEDLDGPALRFAPSQAVASFFLPIVGLYRPYRVVVDLHEASDPSAPGAGGHASGHGAEPWFPARSWWALWLVGPLAASLLDNAALIGGLASFNPTDPTALLSSLEGSSNGAFRALAAAVHVASATLAILVVRAIAWRQRERLRRLEVA